jgi:uncharacterized SAM-binding protein YcdF (DUF218 family)
MESDGSLNDETKARVDKGCQLFSIGNIEKILLMGWDYRDDTTLCISDAMDRYLQDHYSIDRADVLIDRQSRDTVGDAVFSKLNFTHLISQRSCCVVTSDYHQDRTKTIFEFVYGESWQIDVVGVPADQDSDVENNEAASLDAFRHTFSGVESGDDFGILDAMVEKHPYYNGVVYPRIEIAPMSIVRDTSQ